ncbi:MAG: hypothetical protein ACM3X0_06250 [Bacteroidota bacterium]
MNESFEDSCSQCRYFRMADPLTGTCHRFPPAFVGESSSRETHHWRFPTLSIHAWCGEFTPLHIQQPASFDSLA